MANDGGKRAALLWTAVVVVGLLQGVIVWMSVRIAAKTNTHMVRHRAVTVLAGVRSLIRARGPGGLNELEDVLPMLKGPGVLHIAMVGPDLRYRFSSESGEIGRLTPFKAVLRAMTRPREVSSNVDWRGRRARVYVFSRGMHRGMMRRSGPGPLALEVVVDTAWPSWLKAWIGMMSATSLFTVILLAFFAWWIRKQDRIAARLAAQARQHQELRRLGELSAMVAHQLRNPLAGIKGNLQLGLERLSSGRQDAAVQDLDAALDEIRRIETLVKDLLAFTRDMKPRRTATDIAELAIEVAEGLDGVQIDVIPKHVVTCLVDPVLIQQALVNIVHNAAHMGAKRVEIRAGAGPDGCEISIDDDGPGLDPEMAGKVFDPFVSGSSKGTGLGLALVDKVVKAHGGRVDAGRSETLGGARFRLLLPVQEAK